MSIGSVDDAERDFSATYENEGRPHVLGLGDAISDLIPHAERDKCRFPVFSGRHGFRIRHCEPPWPKQGAERKPKLYICMQAVALGSDEYQTIADQVRAGFCANKLPLLQVVHPGKVG